jgi:uncharacterized protein (TIGR03086 family)
VEVDFVDPIDMYRTATTRALEVAGGIASDQLASPTPCSEWTVQDLLDHLVGGTGYLETALGADPTEPPQGATAGDLASGVAACLERLVDPAALEHRSPSPLGFEWSGMQATAGTAMDVLVHTWDLATATGQDTTLDPRVVDACIAMFLPDMPQGGRAAGIIGAAIEVADDASPQERLLGALGRRA